MSMFVLTAKVNIPLNGGNKIEKGYTFEVNLPNEKLPFENIGTRAIVEKKLSRDFDIKGHESILSGGYFDYKKI